MPPRQRYQHGLAKFDLHSSLVHWLMVCFLPLFDPQASAPKLTAGGVVDKNSHFSAIRVLWLLEATAYAHACDWRRL